MAINCEIVSVSLENLLYRYCVISEKDPFFALVPGFRGFPPEVRFQNCILHLNKIDSTASQPELNQP